MNLIKLQRTHELNNATLGELFYQDEHIAYTLEDKVRPVKIKHETAIPAGTYQVIINPSKRFKRMMPRLLNVPGFEGILIHKGNTTASTSGCVIVGQSIAEDRIVNPIPAFEKVFTLIYRLTKIGKVFIEIKDIPEVKEEKIEVTLVEKPLQKPVTSQIDKPTESKKKQHSKS